MNKDYWKVGEIAKQTGLSIRTLHHYDQIGLLSPSKHSESGHRLYTAADIVRLQQIASLRSLGFPLKAISKILYNKGVSLFEVVQMHLEKLKERINLEQQLLSKLASIDQMLQCQETVTTETLIQTIEVINMTEKYPFTEEQMKKIQKQGEVLGPEKIKAVENEWPQLIAKVRAEMEKGTPPTAAEVRLLAKRWKELVEMFTGGDPEILATLNKRYTEQPNYGAQSGIDPAISEYITKAIHYATKN